MPNQIDTDIADCTSNNIFTSSDYKERPITMSITQSNSYDTHQISTMNMDGKDLAISLSASSESLGFDENSVDVDLNLKGSFGVEEEEKHTSVSYEAKCDNTVVSSGGGRENNCETSITSSRTNESKQGSTTSSKGRSTASKGYGQHGQQHGQQHNHPQGPPSHSYHHMQPYSNMPGHPPHYNPHYQRQYYPGAGNGPHYPGGQPQQFDHRFPPNGPQGSYHPGMQYQQPHRHQPYPTHGNYPPPTSYRQGHPPPPIPQSSSNNRHFMHNASDRSVMSVSSHGSSRKRNLDGMMEEDPRNSTSFSKHRSSSNSSTCSTATTGNNTSSETIKQMICESPLKRERTSSPNGKTDLRDTSGALSFGGLTMGTQGTNLNSIMSKPIIKPKKEVDIGVTPVSKNTRTDKGRGSQTNFSFDEEADTKSKGFSPEGHSLNKQLRDQSFTPIHPNDMKRESSSSPTFNEQLEIAPQLSWSIADDTPALGDLSDWPKSVERNASPMSFNGNISPMMFNISPPDTKDDNRKNSSKEEDIMRMGVLSPTDDASEGNRSPPLPYRNIPSRDYPKSHERKMHSPEEMPKHSYQQQAYRMQQPPFPALSPKGSIPLASPPSYQLQSNPPTPQEQKMSHPMHKYDRREDGYHHRHMHPSNREGPPTPNYQSPRGSYPGHGQDRIRNLRGRVHSALPPPIHLPPHFPSHTHFLTSPIGTTPRGMMLSSPHHRMSSHHFPRSPHLTASKRKCIPLKTPIPSKFQGDMEKFKTATVPEFTSLVNFPAHMSQKQASMVPDGMRCCVMCGHACPCSSSNKNRKGGKKSAADSTASSDTRSNIGNTYAIIPTQNKGLCTQCDVNVWVVTNNNLEIKWCKGCKNFRPWAAFGEKGLATKCMRCRERQREKYAAQKEEKDKKKALSKAKGLVNSK